MCISDLEPSCELVPVKEINKLQDNFLPITGPKRKGLENLDILLRDDNADREGIIAEN